VFPGVRQLMNRIGDWLATVGWAKFALVALLLMVVSKLISEILYSTGAPVVVTKGPTAQEKVKVDIKVGVDGIRIERPGAPPAPPLPPLPPLPAAPGSSSAARGDSAITIDENGVRIRSQKDGAPVEVIIGAEGLRRRHRRHRPSSSTAAVP
jgi:hypothetical protein